jgi:hypothetical protein
MGNMSYCRFENTLRDLQDCYGAMRDGLSLSKTEQRKFIQMVDLCREITDMYEDCSEEDLKELSADDDD